MNFGFHNDLPRPVLALAPMSGVTDAAYRRIIAKYGKPHVMYTEFIPADGLISEGLENLRPFLWCTDEKRPLVAQIYGGKPAISYRDFTNKDLKYVRALDATGSSWDTAVTVHSTGDVGRFNSLSEVDGNPAISYLDYTNSNLMYVRASDPQGTAWGVPMAVDTSGCWFTSLEVVDGNPAVAYQGGPNISLRFVRALDDAGSSWDTPQ